MADDVQFTGVMAALPNLTAALIVFAVGTGILLYERFSVASRHFFSVAAIVTVWFLALVFRSLAADATVYIAAWQVGAAFQALTAPALFGLATHLTGSGRRRWVAAAWTGGLAWFTWSLVRPDVVNGLAAVGRGELTGVGLIGVVFVAYIALVMAGVILEFLRGYRRATLRADRRRHLAMLVAMGVGVIAVLDYVIGVPVLGPARLSTVMVTVTMCVIGVAQVRYWAFAADAGFAAEHVLRALGDAVLVCDEAGRVRIVNPEATRLMGGGPDGIVGRPVGELLVDGPCDRADDAGVGIDGILESGPVRDREMCLRSRSGDVIPVAVSAEPLSGFRVPKGFVVVARDIRDRLEQQEAIEASNLRYQSLFWHNPGTAYEIAVDGTFVNVNPAAEELLDAGAGELVGLNFAEVMAPDHLPATQAMFARVLAGEAQEYELDVVSMKGARRTLRGVSIPVPSDDGVAGVFGVALDVTAETRAQRELEVERRYFAELFDGLPEGAALINEEGMVRRVNTEFTRMFGYTRAEAEGRNLDELIVPEADRERAARLGQKAVDAPVMRADLVRRRKGGGLLDVSLLARRFQAPGEELQIYVIYRDVTEQKRTEAKLRQKEEELRHAQRLESVGKLAGGIAHDFNNLLTVINGHARFVLEELDPEARVRADLEEIERAGVRAASLTQQLLAFSRRQVMRPRPLDLNGVVGEMERMLRRLIGTHIRLETSLASSLPRVLADRGQVDQVVMNLVVNARDAMEEGGLISVSTRSVRLADEDPTVAGWDLEPGEYVHLCVEDTGAGMTPAVVARAFDPFFTTKGPGKGTGLGLATVFGIVKQSGGHVTATSEPGEGTRVDVYLPVAPQAAPTSDKEPGRESVPATSEPSGVVLIAEDEPAVRGLAARILGRHGFRVLEAGNGAEALHVAESHDGPIDLLLTDLVMPEMGGRELARRLRTARPETPILFMSGYDDELTAAGFEDHEFMAKPFTPDDLARRAAAMIDRRA